MKTDNGGGGKQEASRVYRSGDASRPSGSRKFTQDQLADVYFQDYEKQKSLPPPTVIRVAQGSRSVPILWVLSLLALSLSVYALFGTKKLWIDVNIIDGGREVAALPQGVGLGAAVAKAAEPDEAAKALREPAETQSFSGATSGLPEAVTLNPMEFEFAGAAVLNSSKNSQQVVLANSTLSGLAYATYKFGRPLQADRYRLVFEARGLGGGERLEFVFKDTSRKSSLNWKVLDPFPEGLGTAWQLAEIALDDSESFNAKAVTEMRIEFGSQRTRNGSDAVVFLKSMQWLPREDGMQKSTTERGGPSI